MFHKLLAEAFADGYLVTAAAFSKVDMALQVRYVCWVLRQQDLATHRVHSVYPDFISN